MTLKGELRHKKDPYGEFMFDSRGGAIMELAAESAARVKDALTLVGLPAVIRPSFTLGGTGGGIAYNREEFYEIVAQGLDASPTNEVLIEESVLGWKEFEMEVVRDKADNAIIICSIENVDPMGVHTGDSMTVAPRADADRQGISAHAQRLDRGVARDRGGDRRLQRPSSRSTRRTAAWS